MSTSSAASWKKKNRASKIKNERELKKKLKAPFLRCLKETSALENKEKNMENKCVVHLAACLMRNGTSCLHKPNTKKSKRKKKAKDDDLINTKRDRREDRKRECHLKHETRREAVRTEQEAEVV